MGGMQVGTYEAPERGVSRGSTVSARTYEVTGPSLLDFDGSVYQPGEPVTLPKEIADPLLADGVVHDPASAAPAKPEGDELQAAIRGAIGKLDPADKSKRTKGGAPKTEALEAVLDFDISAAERDEAWAAVEAERKAAAEAEGKGKE